MDKTIDIGGTKYAKLSFDPGTKPRYIVFFLSLCRLSQN